MKRFIVIILTLSLLFLTGCQSQVTYQADWPHYKTADDLIDASSDMFVGSIAAIHFHVIDTITGKVTETPLADGDLALYTVYEVQVTDVLKGEQAEAKYVCIIGGIPGYNEDDQLSKLKSCGMDYPSIPILVESNPLEIGSTYLFSTIDLGGDYLYVVNPYQFAIPVDTQAGEDATAPNYQNIIEHFE